MKENVAEFLEFRFEKLKLLKRSERGEVWLAQVRRGGELVIIKRVSLTGLPYELIKNFSFKLPAKIFYYAEDESETTVIEEFIQGENLSERKNLLSAPEARVILLQMCDGLKELHGQGIIHRDIKPSNLILQGERIRLIDFDAARIFKASKESDTLTTEEPRSHIKILIDLTAAGIIFLNMPTLNGDENFTEEVIVQVSKLEELPKPAQKIEFSLPGIERVGKV